MLALTEDEVRLDVVHPAPGPRPAHMVSEDFPGVAAGRTFEVRASFLVVKPGLARRFDLSMAVDAPELWMLARPAGAAPGRCAVAATADELVHAVLMSVDFGARSSGIGPSTTDGFDVDHPASPVLAVVNGASVDAPRGALTPGAYWQVRPPDRQATWPGLAVLDGGIRGLFVHQGHRLESTTAADVWDAVVGMLRALDGGAAEVVADSAPADDHAFVQSNGPVDLDLRVAQDAAAVIRGGRRRVEGR